SGSIADNLTTLDLFRFPASHAPTTAFEFNTFKRELKPGVASVFTDTSVSYAMATGAVQGDGNQASHWKDDELTGTFIGIMDPTLGYGVSENVSDSDFRAMDLIGYNVEAVPEPSTIALMLAS